MNRELTPEQEATLAEWSREDFALDLLDELPRGPYEDAEDAALELLRAAKRLRAEDDYPDLGLDLDRDEFPEDQPSDLWVGWALTVFHQESGYKLQAKPEGFFWIECQGCREGRCTG